MYLLVGEARACLHSWSVRDAADGHTKLMPRALVRN